MSSTLQLSSQFLICSSHKSKPKSCHVSPRMSLDPQQRPPTPSPSPSSSSSSSSYSPTTLLTSVTKLLWGPSLPPGLLISTIRTAWTSAWQLMMSQLAPSDPYGNYTRPASRFTLKNNPPSTSSLHLYVGLPCPWAHRTLIVRALKGLEDTVPVSIAAPGQDGSWEFRNNPNSTRNKEVLVPGSDNVNGCKNLKEVYKLRNGGYNGRATVPMLWDVDKKDVVCNESYDIIQFFNSGLNELARNPHLDLSPVHLKEKIEEWNRLIYPNVNNGVYR